MVNTPEAWDCKAMNIRWAEPPNSQTLFRFCASTAQWVTRGPQPTSKARLLRIFMKRATLFADVYPT